MPPPAMAGAARKPRRSSTLSLSLPVLQRMATSPGGLPACCPWGASPDGFGPVELFVPFLLVFANEQQCIRFGQAVLDEKVIAIFVPAPYRPARFQCFCGETFRPMILVHRAFAIEGWPRVGSNPRHRDEGQGCSQRAIQDLLLIFASPNDDAP